eukprot:2655198-Amphidinium_carterae.1
MPSTHPRTDKRPAVTTRPMWPEDAEKKPEVIDANGTLCKHQTQNNEHGRFLELQYSPNINSY